MTEPRRFPPPWSVEEPDPKLARQWCYIVRDANGHALAYVYFEDEPSRRSATRLMTRDEARRPADVFRRLKQLRQFGDICSDPAPSLTLTPPNQYQPAGKSWPPLRYKPTAHGGVVDHPAALTVCSTGARHASCY